MIIVWAFC